MSLALKFWLDTWLEVQRCIFAPFIMLAEINQR